MQSTFNKSTHQTKRSNHHLMNKEIKEIQLSMKKTTILTLKYLKKNRN